jgi:hypothetical protein
MKRLIQLAIALALTVGLAATMMPAEAACGAARQVTGATPGNTQGIFTPGNPFSPNSDGETTPYGSTTSYYINGWFWSFGGGNPIEGLGNDNGQNKGYFGSNWLYVGFVPNPSFMGGGGAHWQYPGTDGCIDFDGSANPLLDPNQCNVVVLHDFNGPAGFFAVQAKNPNGSGNYEYNATTGFPQPLTLSPIPKPFYVNSTRVGTTMNVTVKVQAGPLDPAHGFYLQCPNTPNFPGNLLAGYRLYSTTVPSGAKPVCADSRVTAPGGTGFFGCSGAKAWTPVPGGSAADNVPVNFTIPCDAATDVYLCATLLFGGNAPGAAPWEMKYCSMNATPLECDPQIADPNAKPGLQQRDRKVAPRPSTGR